MSYIFNNNTLKLSDTYLKCDTFVRHSIFN